MCTALRIFAGLVVLTCVLPTVSCSHEQNNLAATLQKSGKVAIPEIRGCTRDNVTFYKGKVLAFKRSDKSITITVRTEWETTEKLSQDNRDNSIEFQLKGQPLKDEDRKRIETLLADDPKQVQATVWTCRMGSKEQIKIIDWDPPAAK